MKKIPTWIKRLNIQLEKNKTYIVPTCTIRIIGID